MILPIAAAYVEDDSPLTKGSLAATEVADALPRLEGTTVLVVDDDEDSRDVVAAFLESACASVYTAGSAAEALDVLQNQNVDVLVADIAMPGGDGYALIGKVRALASRCTWGSPSGHGPW